MYHQVPQILTLPVVHLQYSQSRHVVPQHHLVSPGGLVHSLYHLKVPVGEVQEALMNSNTPGMGQACHYSDAIGPVWVATLNLWGFINIKTAINNMSNIWIIGIEVDYISGILLRVRHRNHRAPYSPYSALESTRALWALVKSSVLYRE